jgi:hypothetical protein
MSDSATSFATVSLYELLVAMDEMPARRLSLLG